MNTGNSLFRAGCACLLLALLGACEDELIVESPEAPPAPEPAALSGVISTGNKTVVVSCSRAMSNSAVDPARYSIRQANVNA